jgi:hypothetical protein
MAGIQNDVLIASNANFSGTGGGGTLLTNGQLWIGSTALNAGGTNINAGTLTSPLGTLQIGYSSPNITIDLNPGQKAVEQFSLQTGTTPINPATGIITFNGATVAAGTNPVRTDGTGPSTMTLEVQISQAIAATDATKIGLAAFNSNQFSVDANGFVSITGGGFKWNDVTTATQTIAIANGYVTDRGGGVTYTLPVTANFGDEFIITGKSGQWTIAQNANQQINFASSSTTVGVGGSLASTNAGDSVQCVCTTAGASTIYRVYNSIGNLTVT